MTNKKYSLRTSKLKYGVFVVSLIRHVLHLLLYQFLHAFHTFGLEWYRICVVYTYLQYMEVYTSFCYISQKSNAFWSLKESHGEAKNGATGEKANFWYSSFWIRLWCLHESCSPRKKLSNAWSYASIRQPRQRESAFYEQSWKLGNLLDIDKICRHRQVIYSIYALNVEYELLNWRRRNFSTSTRFVDVEETCREDLSRSPKAEIEEKSEREDYLQAKNSI